MTDDVASLSVHQFGERFALSALADHSINISMDLPNGIFDSRSVAVIKQITGGDSLSIEAKNRQPHSDHIRCKLLFGTNHSIELKVRDEAFSQRILLVPFCFPFPAAQQDFDLLDKLKQEKRGGDLLRLGGISRFPDRPAFSRALRTHLAGQITARKKRVDGVPLNGYEGIRLK